MNCECGGTLKVTQTYRTPCGKAQRLECLGCLTVYTAAVILVNRNPDRGEGAAALARRLREGEEIQWTLIGS